MKVPVYNKQGEEVKQIELPEKIFAMEVNSDLVHQVVVSQMSNRRQGTAHTKDRSEVRGGGKKPWRQKGTGRARHGSIRSPLWPGGGVTFGPRNEKDYKKRIPKEMKKKALFMVLSGKLKDKEILFVDDFKMEKPKTAPVKSLVEKLFKEKGKTLILLSDSDKNLILGARNIPGIETMLARNINAMDLLMFKNLIFSEDGVKEIEKTFI